MTENWSPIEPEVPNTATVVAIQEARRGGLPTFNSVLDLMADLNSED
jgi:DNA-damage-inducible protein J